MFHHQFDPLWTNTALNLAFFSLALLELIALEKKGAAVGSTLRHLAAKVASGKVMVEMATLLSPQQLGYGVSQRDKMLEALQRLAPSIYPCVHSVYSSPSSLFWSDKIIQSSEGV